MMSFFSNDTTSSELYTLSLHDALPISIASSIVIVSILCVDFSLANRGFSSSLTSPICTIGPYRPILATIFLPVFSSMRSEEHTSELQSRRDLVCRLLLEKKKIKRTYQV